MKTSGSGLTRREFVSSLSISMLAAPLVACSAQKASTVPAIIDHSRERLPYTDGFGSMPCSKCIAPPTMSSRITIADVAEPGQRMVMSGTIFRSDGKTPAEGIVLYVYHTDNTGYYSKDDDPYNPRQVRVRHDPARALSTPHDARACSRTDLQ